MSTVLDLVNKVLDAGLRGLGPLKGAAALAQEYADDPRYPNDDARIDALINWETSKNATSGFLSGLGGLLTLPVTVPAGLGASWAIQARLVGAIACLKGHDPTDDRVRTLALLAIVGDSAKEIAKQAGVQIGNKAAMKALEAVPGKALIAINKAVGFRLLTKAGQKGVINLIQLVPIAGGLVGGTVDALALRKVGSVARDMF